MAMTLLLPDPRTGMGCKQAVHRRRVQVGRFAGMQLDPAEVLGADEAVLAGADEADRSIQ